MTTREATIERVLPAVWEVGSPSDFVLDVASPSAASNDLGHKRDLYARLGIPEYWKLDRAELERARAERERQARLEAEARLQRLLKERGQE